MDAILKAEGMDLKTFLPLYPNAKLICVKGNSDNEYTGMKSNNSPLLFDKHSNGNWKILLHSLSDMTEEEANKITSFNQHDSFPETIIDGASAINFLRGKNFDCDGLIKLGLAEYQSRVGGF